MSESTPSFAERTVLVTGVSRGVGLAIARRLATAGWKVCGVSRTESPEWRALAGAHPGRLEWRSADLSRPAELEAALFSTWLPLQRPVHALVNNAAVAYDDLVSNVQLPRLEEMFAVNVTSAIALSRQVIRNMLLHGTAGALVHLSSVAAHRGSSGLALYGATKGALEAFSRGAAREWGGRGIRSNCVVPGFMETDMTASLSAEHRARIHRRAALPHPTQPESVAATVEFLLGPGASSITGQNLFVDAGST